MLLGWKQIEGKGDIYMVTGIMRKPIIQVRAPIKDFVITSTQKVRAGDKVKHKEHGEGKVATVDAITATISQVAKGLIPVNFNRAPKRVVWIHPAEFV